MSNNGPDKKPKRKPVSEVEFRRMLGTEFPDFAEEEQGRALGERVERSRAEFGMYRPRFRVQPAAEPAYVEPLYETLSDPDVIAKRDRGFVKVEPLPPIPRPRPAQVPRQRGTQVPEPEVPEEAPVVTFGEEGMRRGEKPQPIARSITGGREISADPRTEFEREEMVAASEKLLERAARRAEIARLIETTAPGHVIGGEEALRAMEGFIQMGTLPVRLAFEGVRRAVKPLGIEGGPTSGFPATPAESRHELEAYGLVDPTSELPAAVQGALSPLGITTSGQLAEFIGSLPAMVPYFKAAHALHAPVARQVGQALIRGGMPRNIAEAVATAISGTGTVGGGSGVLAAGEIAAAGGGMDEATNALLESYLHAAIGGIEEGTPSFGLLAGLLGFVRGSRVMVGRASRREYSQQQIREDFVTEMEGAVIEARDLARQPSPVVRSEVGTPAVERAPSEAGTPLRTSEIEAPPRVQAEPLQVSTTATPSPASTIRPSIAAPSELGPATTLGIGDINSSGKMVLQTTTNVTEILSRAQAKQPALDAALQAAVAEIGGEFRQSRLKVRTDPVTREPILEPDGSMVPSARLLEKIATGRGEETISDYLAGRVAVDKPGDFQRFVDQLEAQGFRVLEDDNRLLAPTMGYRARHMQIDMGDGFTAEVQLVPREIADAQKLAHAPYRIFRSETASVVEVRAAMQESEAIFTEAWTAFIKRNGSSYAEFTNPAGLKPEPSGGLATDVLAAGGKTPVRYAVVEARDVIASHDAQTFVPDSRYPRGVQERQYERDPAEQAKVITHAQAFEPRYVITDNPDAINGPPIMTQDGIVLGGNSRAMTMQRVYRSGGGDVIREAIAAQAERFGIEPAELAKLQEPMLVRVMTDPPPATAFRDLVRRFNEPPTQEMGAAARAVAEAGRMSNETLDFFAETVEEGQTVNKWLQNQRIQSDLIRRLTGDGVFTKTNVNRYVVRGVLNEEGRRFVERVMLGKAITDPTILDTAPPELVRRVEKVLPAIARGAEMGGEWDIRPYIEEALEMGRERRAGGLTVEDYLAQETIFATERSRQGEVMFRILEDPGIKATELRAQFNGYAALARDALPVARGQLRMEIGAPPLTPGAAFSKAFGSTGPEFIREAALELPDGTRFTGRTHMDALLDFQEKSPVNLTDVPLDKVREGFETSRGRFVDRDEAYAIAEATDRLDPAVTLRDRRILGRQEGRAWSEDLLLDEAGQTRLSAAAILAMGGTGAVAGAARAAEAGEEFSGVGRGVAALVGAGVGFSIGMMLVLGGGAFWKRIRKARTRPAVEPGGRPIQGLPEATREIPEIDLKKFFEDDQYRNTLMKAGLREREAEVLAGQIVEGAVRSGHYPKQQIPWTEARQTFADMGIRLEDVKRRLGDPTPFNQAEVLGFRDVYREQARLQVALERALQDPRSILTAAERVQLERAVSNIDGLNVQMTAGFLKSGSATARALNAHRAMARITMEPADWWLKAQRQLGDKPLMDTHRAKIQSFIDAKDPDGLGGYVAGLRDVKVPELVTTIWKSFLLGRFPTHFANTSGNLTFGVLLENAKDAVALTGDWLLGMVTRSAIRTKSFDGRAASMKRGAKLGGIAAMEAMGKSAPYDISVLTMQLGAAAGAAVDDESRLRGAIFGAMAGIGAGTAGALLGLRAARKARTTLTDVEAQRLGQNQARDMLKKYDIIREIHFDNVVLETALNAPYRQLVAGDQLFRFFAIERKLSEMAAVIAKNEGLKGPAYRARVKGLIDNPTGEMSLMASAEGDYALFQNEGILAAIATGIKRSPQNLRRLGDKAALGAEMTQGALEFVIPFTRTPANLASRTVEYSPFGYLRTGTDAFRLWRAVRQRGKVGTEELMPEVSQAARELEARIFDLQTTAAESLGRATIGLLPIWLGFDLASQGLMTSWYPQTKSKIDQWRLEQKRSNSIWINGKWASVERISPIGNLMMLGAAMYRAVSDPETAWAEKAFISAAAIPRSVAEQSFLTGLTAAGEAFRRPEERAPAFARSLVRSLVPGVISAAGQMFDTDDDGRPIVRPTKDMPLWATLVAQVPGLRKIIPEGVDQFGETTTMAIEPWQRLIDPFTVTADRAKDDPVLMEMRRLGYNLTRLTRWEHETDDQFLERQRSEGRVVREAFERLVDHDTWYLMDNEAQLSAMGDISRNIKTRYKRRFDAGREMRPHEIGVLVRRALQHNYNEMRLGRRKLTERQALQLAQ